MTYSRPGFEHFRFVNRIFFARENRWDCARIIGLHYMELAKSRFPKLLKTLETKIVDRAIGEGSSSLQARGVTGSIPVTSTNLTNARTLGASTTVFAT